MRHMSESGWQPGVDPQDRTYASFADFADPDGNSWTLQEVGHRTRRDDSCSTTSSAPWVKNSNEFFEQ